MPISVCLVKQNELLINTVYSKVDLPSFMTMQLIKKRSNGN